MRAASEKVAELTAALVTEIERLETVERIDALNEVRAALHEVSPLKHHPVDYVRWVPAEDVAPCGYGNPNFVAPPEMRLLEHSVEANGYTMPVVTHEWTVTVDGHHRRRLCVESKGIAESTLGFLPTTKIRAARKGEQARIAATIEHNRARGEHQVDQMSALVQMLYQAGWRDDKIQKELGMDADEVRRLKQITGLAELFSEREFSEAWEPAPQ